MPNHTHYFKSLMGSVCIKYVLSLFTNAASVSTQLV